MDSSPPQHRTQSPSSQQSSQNSTCYVERRAELSYQQIGTPGGRRVWILHGIMGSKQNWSRFARRLSAACPHLEITSIDLRCHGETPHLQAKHTVESCAADLEGLATHLKAPQVIIAHSFGGKVALTYGARCSPFDDARGLERIWTLDSALAAQVPTGHSEVAAVIEACQGLPLPQANRQGVTDYFKARGFSLGVAQWMTTNVRRLTVDEEQDQGMRGFIWRFDLEGIKALIDDYWRVDGWELLREIPESIDLHLLRAERGLRWDPEDVKRLQREVPRAHNPLLHHSGHWVHIEQLEALIALISAQI